MSPKCLRIERTGLRAFIPDCSTIAKPPWRWVRSSSSFMLAMSRPSKRIVPLEMRAGALARRVTAKPRVDFPEPDSPTRPTNSPRSREKEAFLTA